MTCLNAFFAVAARRAARSGDYFCHDVMTCNQMATAMKPVYGMRQIENIPGLMWSEVCRRYSRTARSLVIVRKFHIMFLLIKVDAVHQEECVLQPQNFAGGKPLRCHFKSSLVHPRSGGKSGDLPFSHKLVWPHRQPENSSGEMMLWKRRTWWLFHRRIILLKTVNLVKFIFFAASVFYNGSFNLFSLRPPGLLLSGAFWPLFLLFFFSRCTCSAPPIKACVLIMIALGIGADLTWQRRLPERGGTAIVPSPLCSRLPSLLNPCLLWTTLLQRCVWETWTSAERMNGWNRIYQSIPQLGTHNFARNAGFPGDVLSELRPGSFSMFDTRVEKQEPVLNKNK